MPDGPTTVSAGGIGPWARVRAAVLGTSIAAFLGGLSCRPSSDAPLSIIDAHVHTDFTGAPEPASGIPDTRERFFEDLARAGVVGAVAHMGVDGAGYVDLSDHGVIHCASPGPAVDVIRLEEGLRAGTHRCIKIYLGYVPRYPTDSAYEPVYALARRFDVPVVFHTGDTYSADARLRYAHPLAIDDVAVGYRDVDFVIAHAGYPWIRTAAEVAYKNPNVYLEASAFMIGDPGARPREWVDRYVVEPIAWIFGYVEDPTKLLFGSDWPLVDIAGYVEAYRRAIPPEHWRAVFHDNAVRVFRLDRAPVTPTR